jgi:hypothetical protein
MLGKSACDGVHSTHEAARKGVSCTGLKPAVVLTGALALIVSLSGCSHLPSMHFPSMHWPWHHAAPPPPEVHELDETSQGGASASFPQYWSRNTLVVNLQGASGSGSVVLKPREGTAWPVRIAFKVMPGTIGELEVQGAQRTVLPITTAGAQPVLLELSPGIYVPKTRQMTVSWSPNTTPAS